MHGYPQACGKLYYSVSCGMKSMYDMISVVDSAVTFDTVILLMYYMIHIWCWLPLKWLVLPPYS